ncbi:F(420)H(2) dehydrogenase subunit L [uncultured archaeon]|nr:F(420)H(2) dehydrogenase subunit L [uncultured archaeon]
MFISKGGRLVRRISLSVAAISCILLLAFSSIVVYQNQALSFSLYQMLPALQFSFFIDRLAAFFILIISIISLSVSIYSIGYIEHYSGDTKKNSLVSLMILFMLSMILVVASKTLFSFLFFWEIMALSSFILVMFEYEKKETRKAGIFYFIMTQLSTVFLLLAFIMIYNATGSFDIAKVSDASPFVFLFLFAGFGIKAGIIPFHKWLPYAHPASPSNISALMSGIMIKVAIYGLMRFVLFVLTPELSWGLLIFGAGVISAIFGVIYALKEHDIKRLLAYHSIENIGIILIGFGLYIIFSAYGLTQLALLGIIGALFHTMNHALFKSLLFLTAGSVVNATETKNIEEMGGLIKSMPYTALFFFIGAISISALPPFNGFVSEFMIFQAFLMSWSLASPMLEVLMIVGLTIFALTSALAAACFVKAFGITFLAAPRSEHAKHAKESSFSMLLGPAILAILCVVSGVFSYQIFSLLGYASLVPNLMIISIFLVAVYAFAFVSLRAFASNNTRIGETWGCGILSQNPRMEYTASGFSEPIVTVFKSVYKTKKTNHRTFFDKYQSIFREGAGEIQLFKFFEEYLYMPVARATDYISRRVSCFQRKDLDFYIACSFVTVLVLLLIMGWLA